MAKKPQTEEKAKGLIGLSKGKKVAGAQNSVGNYRGRTLNLSAKQIAKSGVKGARSAARQGATSISDTKFEKGKGVTKGGKLFTGNVDLGGGNIAVYVGGKRVRAAKGKSPGGGRNGNPNPPSRGASTISTTSAERLRSARNADRKTGRPPSTISTTSAEKLRSSRNADRKPPNVAQSVWDKMSNAQKAALVAGLLYPGTRPAAALITGAIASNYAGTKVANMRKGSTKKQTRPLKMWKTYPKGK